MIEEILGVNSAFVALCSLGLFVFSVNNRERLTSNYAWNILKKKFNHIKRILELTFVSLVIFLLSESAELFSLQFSLSGLETLHKIGEAIHMIIAVVVMLMIIPLILAMVSGEDDN